MRRIAVMFGLLGLIGGVGAGGAAVWARAEKHAPAHGGNFSIKTIANQSFCVESEGDGRVIVSTCASRNVQRWTLTDDTDGSNVITDGFGECLDRGTGKVGTPITTAQCSFDASQRFSYSDRSGHLRSPGITSCVADAKAAQDAAVFMTGCASKSAGTVFALGE